MRKPVADKVIPTAEAVAAHEGALELAPFARYNRFLLAVLGTALAAVVATGVYLDPLVGNLTRMGGYPENHFGWNAPQEYLEGAVSRYDDVEGDYDVLVLGDSFSNQKGGQTHLGTFWQNYFWRLTGASTVTFDRNRVDAEAVIERFVGRERPPRLVIYELTESDWGEVVAYSGKRCQGNVRSRPGMFSAVPRRAVTRYERRKTKTRGPMVEVNQAVNVLTKALLRTAFGQQTTDVGELQLTTRQLFSSRVPDRLLVYSGDFRKRTWKPQFVERGICGLLHLQTLAQRTDKTSFIALLVPDKLTAYRDYLVDRDLAGLSWIGRIAADGRLPVPRLDLAIRQVLREGVMDLYLPNDTHWGDAGHRLAAEVLVDYLRSHGVIFFPGQTDDAPA